MQELFEPKSHHELTVRSLLDAVIKAGGDINSLIVFESDGEPVYITKIGQD